MINIYDSENILIDTSLGVSNCARKCFGCNRKSIKDTFIDIEKLLFLDKYVKENFQFIKGFVFTIDFFKYFNYINNYLDNKNSYNGLTYLFMSDINNFIDFDKKILIDFIDKNNDEIGILFTIDFMTTRCSIHKSIKSFTEFLALTNNKIHVFLDLLGMYKLFGKEKLMYYSLFKNIAEIYKKKGLDITISLGSNGENCIIDNTYDKFFREYFLNCHVLENKYLLEVSENRICFHGQFCNYLDFNNFGDIYTDSKIINFKANNFINKISCLNGVKGDLIGENACIKCMEYFGVSENKYKNFLPNNYLDNVKK